MTPILCPMFSAWAIDITLHKNCILGLLRCDSLSSCASHAYTFRSAFFFLFLWRHFSSWGCAHLSRADNNWHNPTWQSNLLCKTNENWFSWTVTQMRHFSLYCSLFLPSPTLKSRAWKTTQEKLPTPTPVIYRKVRGEELFICLPG